MTDESSPPAVSFSVRKRPDACATPTRAKCGWRCSVTEANGTLTNAVPSKLNVTATARYTGRRLTNVTSTSDMATASAR